MKISPEKIDEMFPNEGEDFATMLSRSEQSEDNVLREGKIVKIDDESVMIDVQDKKEGRMSIDEIKDSNGNLLFKQGDSILVHVSKKGGLRISYKKAIKYEKVVNEIKALGTDYKDKVVEGVIRGKNKGGYIVESANGVEYFMPRHYSALSRDKDDSKVVGKPIKACIVDIRPNGNSIVISRKRYLDTHTAAQKENAKKILDSGLAYEGVVKNVTKFGLFVEIGSVDGLVHFTEISHRGPVNPEKHYKVGDKVQVKPLEYNEEKNRLSLSIRALFDDPWKEIKDEIKVGYVIRVTVSNIEDYGAFVDLGNDVEGFLHISEMSWDKNIKQPSDCLKVGEEINVEVIEIDPDNRRLRVSLKKLQDKPFVRFTKEHKVGDVIKGKVATITNFGAFVNLGSVDGLLHNEDAFWDKSKKCADEFKVGDSIEVKIDKIDTANEKISLNRRYLVESPSEQFAKKYAIDDEISGQVIDIKDFGVFIKVENENIDALIRNEDLGNIARDSIKVGDTIKGALVQVDRKANRVRLSVRRLQKKKERQELNDYNSDEKVTLGDTLGDKFKNLGKK
ncbi:30S ribosomal protein S1 [Helicobacter bilis]|uniref:30S ribosomal protein S1 n=2 Tax=Helicobacter bilis TaxID=37372 RepID=A0A6D2CFH1_9HELI|nr:30S ribosomal protein S1 [Helicobacter bilis]EMZ41227.1 ribosomal protein S1 [Helicobacter bilis WiWa]TLE06246.1 30S ribosomal protein S1 [Helicobacter bilis]TLE07093.1 30S ribosomal protein S1 [Helicobacter bilis]